MNKKVYVSIQDYQENEKLPGAVSTETEFAYLDNGEIGFIPMWKHVPETIRKSDWFHACVPRRPGKV